MGHFIGAVDAGGCFRHRFDPLWRNHTLTQFAVASFHCDGFFESVVVGFFGSVLEYDPFAATELRGLPCVLAVLDLSGRNPDARQFIPGPFFQVVAALDEVLVGLSEVFVRHAVRVRSRH